jgi:hypothetical protein
MTSVAQVEIEDILDYELMFAEVGERLARGERD